MDHEHRPDLSSMDALRTGWDRLQNNTRLVLALGGLSLLTSLLHQRLWASSGSPEAHPLLALCVQLIQLFLTFVMLRLALQMIDGRPLTIERSARTFNDYCTFLLTSMLYAVVVAVGFVLLIFPGVIWSLKFAYAPMLVLDQRLDPLAAMHESARLTERHKLRLLGLLGVLFLVNMLGALTFGVGLVITVPLTFLTAAHGLRQLQALAASTSGAAASSHAQPLSA